MRDEFTTRGNAAAVAPRSRPADLDRVRRLLLKSGLYTAPAVLATTLLHGNVYASGLNTQNQNKQGPNQNKQGPNQNP